MTSMAQVAALSAVALFALASCACPSGVEDATSKLAGVASVHAGKLAVIAQTHPGDADILDASEEAEDLREAALHLHAMLGGGER